MLLRRVIDHVKTQNWTAIALDFLIVVSGVFIGIQVSNLNQARSERLEEARLMQELRADITADIAEMEDLQEMDEIRIVAISRVLEAAGVTIRRRGDLISDMPDDLEWRPDDPFAYPIAVRLLRTLDGNRHTYNTLINTGRVRIVRDTQLAREIQDYYAAIDEFRDGEGMSVIYGINMAGSMRRLGVHARGVTTLEDFGGLVAGDAQLAAEMSDLLSNSLFHRQRIDGLIDRAKQLIEHLQ